jgi:hypothetical protein
MIGSHKGNVKHHTALFDSGRAGGAGVGASGGAGEQEEEQESW